jgi:DHA1 family multidrug resistance protein-like MFS transporter
MSVGFYMLVPLLSVHFTGNYGMSAATVGVVFAARQFTQQGLMIFGGVIGDRWGHKWTISGGFLVRALGFLWFAYARDVGALIGAAVVTGLGGALFEATGKAALAALVAPDRRVRLFSVASLIASVGSALGPLIGVALLNVDFLWVGLVSSGCFFLASGLACALLPSSLGAPTAESNRSIAEALSLVVRDARFVRFTVVMAGYWFVANQIYLSVPIHISRLTGDVGLVGTTFAAQAVLAMALQVPLVRVVCRVTSRLRAIGLGLLLMSVGLGSVALATDGYGILACVLIFAIGRLLVEPVRDVVTADLAPTGSSAAYFGFGYLSLAFGGSLGNLLGGRLMDLAVEPELGALPWAVFAVVGVCAAAAMASLDGGSPARSRTPRGTAG